MGMFDGFGPERKSVLESALQLARTTFERERPLSSRSCSQLARAIVVAADEGLTTADRLAARAIVIAVMGQVPGRSAA